MSGIDTISTEGAFESSEVSDDELTALALAADPNVPLSPDAVPWIGVPSIDSALPAWYMPPAVALRTSTTTRIVVAAIILGFLVIDSFGLCVTSGFISLA